MPQMNGDKVYTLLKAQSHLKNIPLIFITARASQARAQSFEYFFPLMMAESAQHIDKAGVTAKTPETIETA